MATEGHSGSSKGLLIVFCISSRLLKLAMRASSSKEAMICSAHLSISARRDVVVASCSISLRFFPSESTLISLLAVAIALAMWKVAVEGIVIVRIDVARSINALPESMLISMHAACIFVYYLLGILQAFPS